ncbi:glucokinase [Peptoclostridium litorale DSM 5388]|uniref:Glucokinase GlkA n=1 Tax=Peptoclostridium litorale DSM 5388 TaxID=1121324 RepID=A0A069RPY0_PEPLI|nr:ROK family protein [Peptoclostridium litorale]KDR96237.1 glucokinase GlkA [Peptoclostridium litorale DSM 5388]SIO14208.1 glucokinase [Peptoclostridium litorale DSM 5388]
MNIGVDIGGTNIAAGIVDDGGRIIKKITASTNRGRGYGAVVKEISIILNALSKDFEGGRKVAVGLAIPGVGDEYGNVIKCVNLGWRNVPLSDDIKKLTGMDCVIENDSNAAAVGEYRFGSMKGKESFVMLTLGTGLGSGIIDGGRLMKGFHGAGAEIGHMVVGENFYNCTCGKNGCLETFASASALVRYFKRIASAGDEYTVAIDMAGGDVELVDSKIITQAAMRGDVLSLMAFDRLCKYLATGIVNIINVIDPQEIVIGGGLSGAGDFLLEKVDSYVKKSIFYNELTHARVRLALLGDDAGVAGAAALPEFLKYPI